MSEYWFKPKRYGIGAGLPIHWKGWALFIAMIACLLAVPTVEGLYFGYEPNIFVRALGIGIVLAPFLWVVRQKTEGGWHWRNGKEPGDPEP